MSSEAASDAASIVTEEQATTLEQLDDPDSYEPTTETNETSGSAFYANAKESAKSFFSDPILDPNSGTLYAENLATDPPKDPPKDSIGITSYIVGLIILVLFVIAGVFYYYYSRGGQKSNSYSSMRY